jgi:ABC-type lipoprotein export system ATPase subunit
MRFCIEIKNIRPIDQLKFEIDLDQPSLVCIAGKNGVGKTTLAKAMMSLFQADTFVRTSTSGVFDVSSFMHYSIDDDEYIFTYDPAIGSISTKNPVLPSHKKIAVVELPAPHGQRFTFFRVLADKDAEIRRAIVLNQYQKPTELIEFLSNIYGERRFDDLVEVQFRGGTCCCYVQPDQRYIREDYFSSGEYFLINLYRKVIQGTRLVFIDEIDISLDANAQAHIAEQLRKLSEKYRVKIVFTSHSMALMQTLNAEELYYFERTDGEISLLPMSFNTVKSLMFGFRGWDRYLLTEDERLVSFLRYVVARYCAPTFYTHQIMYCGGGGQTVGLMRKNAIFEFLGPSEHVITVLDGDLAKQNQEDGVYFIPFENIETAFWTEYQRPDFPFRIENDDRLDAKQLVKRITTEKKLSFEEIFELLCDKHNEKVNDFSKTLTRFLCRPVEQTL